MPSVDRGKAKDLNIMVAGAAGQGMQTTGAIMGKVFVRGGCEVFAMQDNESRIRGGHNFFQLRVSHEIVRSSAMPLDILIALNEESIEKHNDEVASTGVILFDSEKNPVSEEDNRFLGVPMERLAVDKGGNKILANSVSMGATLAVLDWDIERLEDFLKAFFQAKPGMGESNATAARAGYEFAMKEAKKYGGPRIASKEAPPRMFLTGHEAVALGVLTAGCQFMCAYPMSPSTSIMMYLAEKADDFDMVIEQAEDEISAMNMAIGASYAGLRSLTASSGGGFALMVEALGLAGVAETPLVVVEAQRPGPATGLPTRTEQADLLFMLHASQDEFPRVILAPGTAREAFYQTIKAFDLAEKYQVPVIILTDQYLADSLFTEERFDISDVRIDRHLLSQEDAKTLKTYNRYQLTDSGVSPRAVPSLYDFEVVADSHEHDEYGHITEDAGLRKKMVEKRFLKLKGLTEEMTVPAVMGNGEADYLLVGWGSTYGPMAEAIQILNDEGIPVKGLHLSELWPFPQRQVSEVLSGVRKWVVVEGNYTAQLARLIQMELQAKPHGKILKYTGRPFMAEEIKEAFKKEVVD